MMNLFKKIYRRFNAEFLPCYVIERNSFLLFFAYWEDFYRQLPDFAKVLKQCEAEGKKTYAIFQFGWHYETEARIAQLKKELSELDKLIPYLEFSFNANSKKEKELLDLNMIPGILAHQNAFLNENIYRASPEKKIYSAIYIARITPFKRHFLAQKIDRLKLIGDYSKKEKTFAENTLHSMLDDMSWTRHVSYRKIDVLLNRSSVGLALSAEEGAMFVAAEYMLCGLPVISTPNLGGRDELLVPEYLFRPDEENPDAIAALVKDLEKKSFDSKKIRNDFIRMMQPHRQELARKITEIYYENGIVFDAWKNWKKWFCHKLGLRTTVLPLRRLMHGLRK